MYNFRESLDTTFSNNSSITLPCFSGKSLHHLLYFILLIVINVYTYHFICPTFSDKSLHQSLCADIREVRECSLSPSEFVPGNREEAEGSCRCGDGGLGQPDPSKRPVWSHPVLYGIQKESLLHVHSKGTRGHKKVGSVYTEVVKL